MNNISLEFDTNEYTGDSIILGQDLPEDSEYYTLKYVDNCINMKELEDTISTEGIKDIYNSIKETILKMLEWIYNKITAFINYLKDFFYSLEKTIDTTISTFDRCTVGRDDTDLMMINNKEIFKRRFKSLLFISNDTNYVFNYVSDGLSNDVLNILDKCEESLTISNNIVNEINLEEFKILSDCHYLNKESYVHIDNSYVIKEIPIPIMNNDIGLNISVNTIVDCLNNIKNNNKIKDIEKSVSNLKSKYKVLIKEVRNTNDDDLKNIMNLIKILGVTLPTNLLKTYTFIIKDTVDMARYFSAESMICGDDLIWFAGGPIGYRSGRRI